MKDKKKKAILVKLKKDKQTIWKAFDCKEFVVARELSPKKCKMICERKGYVVR